MNGIASLTSRVVRSWAAAYTIGLPPGAREQRRMEIASDVWEQHHAEGGAGRARISFAMSLLSRMVRGIPADVLWRVNVEGPQMDIKIPFERTMGILLLAMVVLVAITSSISGYDMSAAGFDGELRRLAALSTVADNANAFFRAVTGFALLGGAAGFYVALHERSRTLSTMVAFGLCAAGVLELVAGALQLTFVELAEEYVASSGARQEQVLVTARAVGLAVDNVTGAAFLSLVLSTYVLAFVATREALVPRWSVGIPMIGATMIVVGLVAASAGIGDGWMWFVLASGMLSSMLWLLFAGLWMLFTPTGERNSRQSPTLAAQ